MPKSNVLNFTQNLNNTYVNFYSSDVLRVIMVSPNSNGTGLTDGTRTFTAAGGTLATGAAATWTSTVTGGRVIGAPVITNQGQYTVTPGVTGNAATVDSGTTNATWNLKTEFYKELYTASVNDAVVKAINVASTDTAARVLTVWLIGADNQPEQLCALNVPLRSGDNGTANAIDLLNGTLLQALPYDANGKRIIPLKAGQKLAVSVPAVTAGTQINVSAMIEEY
jgi:hypothetical protein